MKTIKCLLIAIILLSLFNPVLDAKKKIIWQNTGSFIRNCQMIDSLNYIVVGDDGKIIASKDGGDNWQWLETGLRQIFFSVDFLDLQRGAVAGDSGVFALTSDAGKSWKTGIIDTTPIYNIQMFDENTIFAQGENTCIYKSNDFGNSWKKVFPEDIYVKQNWFFFYNLGFNTYTVFNNSDIFFTGNDSGFACGVGPFVLKTTDGGESWRKVLQAGDSSVFTRLDFYDAQHGFAVGGKMHLWDSIQYFGLTNMVYYTSDGGENWEEWSFPIEGPVYGIKMYDNDYIYFNVGTRVALTKDHGKSWEKFHRWDYKYYKNYIDTMSDGTPRGNDYNMLQPSYNNNGSILAISRDGAIFKSSDFGFNFTTIKRWIMNQIDPGSMVSFYTAISVSLSKLYAAGNKARVFSSSDSGTSWDQEFPNYEIHKKDDNVYWNKIGGYKLCTGHFTDSSCGIIAGDNSVYTSDGGISWQLLNNLSTQRQMAFINKDTGFAINEITWHNKKSISIFRTDNGGISWDSINYIPTPVGDIEQAFFYANQIIFPDSATGYLTVFNGWSPTSDTFNYPNGHQSLLTIYKSEDFFKTLVEVCKLPYKETVEYKLKFIDKNTVFLGKNGNVFLKTTDGFQSFDTLLLPGSFHFINDLYFIDENYGIAVGRQDTIFTTYDGGISWKIEVLPFNKRNIGAFDWRYTFEDISRAMNGDIFLTGQGRIVRGIIVDDTTNIGVDSQTEGVHTHFYYISLLPNPVLGTAKIKIIGLEYAKSQKLFLRIYDINGNFVKDLSTEITANNDGKTAEFQADLSSLSSGIYFIELEANNLTRAQKFIKY